DNRLFADHIGEELQCLADVGLPALGRELQKLTDDPQYMAFSLFGRDIEFHGIGEEDKPHLIVVLQCGKGKGGGDFGDDLLFELPEGAEEFRSTHVHHQHHGQSPFFLANFYEGLVVPGRDVPVYAAHIVPELVLPDLAEGHSPTLEGRVVLPPKDMVGKTPGLYFNFAYFFK